MFRNLRLLVPVTCALASAAVAAEPVADARPRVLNNLVTRLLTVEDVPQGADVEYTFTNPRAGWVFFATTAKPNAGAEAELSLDGKPIGDADPKPGAVEAMRFLPAGQHKLRVKAAAAAPVERVVVNAIAELMFSRFGSHPQVVEYGRFDAAWMNRHALPNLNCMVGGSEVDPLFLEHWKKQGRRFLVEIYAKPYLSPGEWTAKKAFDYWTASPGMTNPLMDGLIVDEFFRSNEKNADRYKLVMESVRMIRDNPKYKDKFFYPYITTLYGGKLSEEFIKLAIDSGYKCPWERYLHEKPTIEEAKAYFEDRLVGAALAYNKAIPGSIEHFIVCFGHMISAPPESVNSDPRVGHKYYMEMQFNLIATHAAFKGLYGVMEYLSAYTDEEYARWAMRLYRHYCVEGNTTMLSDEYGYTFAPDHLTNPDFDDGLAAWTVKPAEPGFITSRSHKGYSWLQGRYPETRQGDTFLLAERNAKAPNTFSQKIRNLKPGGVYSVKMFTGDYGDLLAERSGHQLHSVALRVDGAEKIPSRSFRHAFSHCYSHNLGKFTRAHRYWMNYHQLVFRATGPSATLTVSDWTDPERPSGPIGQRLAFNFFEVQPYYVE